MQNLLFVFVALFCFVKRKLWVLGNIFTVGDRGLFKSLKLVKNMLLMLWLRVM